MPVRKLEINVRDRKICRTTRTIREDNMADNNQNSQDSTQQIIDFLKSYKWRIIGFFAFLIIAILFLTLGFWKTILIIVLCLIGIGVGYMKDRTQDFMNFLNRWS